ncbi:hypothetical protein AJL11_08455 [Listeria monocytogenes]|uniref:Uncharacterized protein n=1 Tax=Listeria monocytogenes TaxID=1639 RepID=A0A823ISV4_LISMN|nr:hypothetical protein [Listeria monocytogenes]EAC8433388.1 hypothetical protein [Listeria monocytogenes]EAE5921379.1 hypothetical protein [Listeria monocytogenes]EAF6702253.1 hypothetical protein [Listeria monocytogenes]EAG6687012.1 hypothetical protein [Listeria monocytogenes]EAG9220979.1 hypothetical protein [Listeria monocytogenes]
MKNIDKDLFLRKNQLEGTMYVEFKYSSAEKEFWNEDSYYINSDIFEYLLGVFEKSKEDFSMFGENYFSFEEVDNLINNLKNIDLEGIADKIIKNSFKEDKYIEKIQIINSLINLVQRLEAWLVKAIELDVIVIILGI